MDFLNANPIRYALTINPTIYISCVEQFWFTVKSKTINGEVQLQAIVDGKKIIITESVVRRDLQLEDDEGVDCLPNATIFEQLALIGYEQVLQKLTFYKAFFSQQWKLLIHMILQCLSAKTTVWNEFSSTMASAIICLATDQKFNFSKYIFESMVKNLENVSGKFLMYPRFVQVFLDQQLEGMSSHNRIYVTPSHTKKIFRNMRRVGKGFSGRETPLFQTMVVQEQAEIGEGSANPTDPHHTPTIIQPSPQPQKKQKPRKPKRKDTQIPQSSGPTEHVADEAVYKELDDSLVRAATTASSLEAEQDSGNIDKTQSKSVSKLSNDPLLARGNTLQSGEDSVKLNELIELCTNLQQKVLDLETTKTTQANEIASLKRKVTKLEKKKRSRTHGLKRLYKVGLSARVESSGDEEDLGEDASKQGRIIAIDADKDITLVNDQDDADMFDVNTLAGEEVFVTKQSGNVVEEVVVVIDAASTIPVSAATIIDVEVTLAQAIAELKSAKPKADKVVIQEPKQGTTTTTPTTIISVPKPPQDKGKGIMIEEPVVEQVKPMKRLEQIRLDEELAFKLQAKEEEEERLAREKAQQIEEANIQRRKHFAAKRAEEKRNKPPTQAQQRKIICTYLKNMERKKPKDLKNKSFDYIQKMFDIAFKRVNTFVDFRTDLVECSSKRAGEELEQESIKKQKVDEDREIAELQSLIKVIPDEEEVAIDVVPLATKPPSIVDWKIHKEGKKSYYQIIRADGKSQMYRIFSQMLKSFSREDLEDLYKLVKAKYGSTRPVEDLDVILYGDLKTMFEPHVEDQVWKNQDDYKVLDWKLYDSCGVHSLRMQHVYIHMLVEKRYPLKPSTITDMLNKKLQVDYLNEMAYQLLKLLIK
ncbi:hypothetical protein Tco_1007210 [Tanacetum coccineum]